MEGVLSSENQGPVDSSTNSSTTQKGIDKAENGDGESPRVQQGNKHSQKQPKHIRAASDSNKSIVNPKKSPSLKSAATSRTSAVSNPKWALVRYGENLEEEDDAEPGNQHGTLVRRSGLDTINAELHLAARRGATQVARHCLDNDADIESKTDLGETALHLAVLNEHDNLVLHLLERGANAEAAMDNGSKPLYIAATQGQIQIAKLLLRAHANPKSLNSKTLKTALDQAITNNHLEIVKLLLDAGLDINILSSDGNTPLYLAATYNRIRIVELLLEYGADKKIPLHDGSIVQDHIARGSAVALVLRQPPILKGPPVNVPKRLTSSIDFHTPPSIPTGLGSYEKRASCHGFEATIVDFFLDNFKNEEQRIMDTASIHELLYGKGPERIMLEARGDRLYRQTRAFRWYHLPANNMEWIQALVARITAERKTAGTALLDEETKSSLGLSDASGHAFYAKTSNSYFMRPQCQVVKPQNQLMLFMPFLHFETLLGYDMMAKTVSQVQKIIAFHSDSGRKRERQFRTELHSQDVSKDVLERNQIPYEISISDPRKLIILRYVPCYEMEMLRKQTKLLRENSKSSPDDGFDFSTPEEEFYGDVFDGENDDFINVEHRSRSEVLITSQESSKMSLGQVAALRWRFKKQEEPIKVQFPVTPRKQRLSKKHSDITENAVPDVEKLAGRSGSMEGDVDHGQKRKGLLRTLHFSGIWKRRNHAALDNELDHGTSDQSFGQLLIDTLKNTGLVLAGAATPINEHDQSSLPSSPGNILPSVHRPPLDSWRGHKSSDSFNEARQWPISPANATWGSRSRDLNATTQPVSLSSQPHKTARQESSKSSIINSKDLVLFDASSQSVYPAPSSRTRRSLSTERHLPPSKSSPSPSLEQSHRRLSELNLAHPQSQTFTNSDPSYTQQRRVFIAKDDLDSENDSDLDSQDQAPNVIQNISKSEHFTTTQNTSSTSDTSFSWFVKDDGKSFGIYASLVSKKVLIDLGYPFREEGGFFVIIKNYDAQLLAQILELSRMERRKEKEGTRTYESNGRDHLNGRTSSEYSETDNERPENQHIRVEPRTQALARRPETMSRKGIGYMTTDLLNEHLIKGYLVSSNDQAIPPLQLRRTLDQYFYTHLKSTSQRDSDQVVYRHTKLAFEPKIFMVDQIWLWIFDHETIISCCPQQWDSAADQKFGFDKREYRRRSPHDLPLDVRQAILKHLIKKDRAAITSVHHLAEIIISSCANIFNTFQIRDEFQFLDFFERSIGNVIEKESLCFQAFSQRLVESRSLTENKTTSNNIFDITRETALLVEIKDIHDELGVLRMVLNDQKSVMTHFDQIATLVRGTKIASDKTVLDSHLYRIAKMDQLAQKTYEALNHLLDLKQKQANASEARSARKQAEDTAVQAEQTTKQGKTVLVFTVVTIIFLPLSFMAAFFAINIEKFPFNDSGKLPLSYVLKYLFSISIAVSIPFIILAFNQEKVSNMTKATKVYLSSLNQGGPNREQKEWSENEMRKTGRVYERVQVNPEQRHALGPPSDGRSMLAPSNSRPASPEPKSPSLREMSRHSDPSPRPPLIVEHMRTPGRPLVALADLDAPVINETLRPPNRNSRDDAEQSEITGTPGPSNRAPRDNSEVRRQEGIPPNARWTKISRKLVSPEALDLGHERYDIREHFVIVLRVLTRDEVQEYAEMTQRIRAMHEEGGTSQRAEALWRARTL